MATVEIDRDAAREAAERELSKPIYPRPSLLDRVNEWLNELVHRLMVNGSDLPGGWFTLALLAALVVIAILVAVRIARRTIRTSRGSNEELFGSTGFSAAEHRATAERSAAEGNWSSAIRHRLRALARQLEEDGVLQPVPGRTANELAREAGQALPELREELSYAATCFNDVSYGEQPGNAAEYDRIADLDKRLRSREIGAAAPSPAPVGSDKWADLQ